MGYMQYLYNNLMSHDKYRPAIYRAITITIYNAKSFRGETRE